MADPGFPVGGGHGPHRGAVDPQGSYVSKILHVKMKESGPVGGGAPGACPLDPPMRIMCLKSHWTSGTKNYFDGRINNCDQI